MLAGVSTACLFPNLTEESFGFLVENGVTQIEVFLNSYSELEFEYLKKLRHQADFYGTKIVGIHPFTSGVEPFSIFGKYERRFEDERENYRAYYEAANILGTDCVVLHGALKSAVYEEYLDRYGLVLSDAERFGVKLCQENVRNFFSHSPDVFKRLKKDLPQAQFVFDAKQARLAGFSTYEFLEAMQGRIHHVHYSDFTPDNPCVLPDRAITRECELIPMLTQVGFNGTVIIEVYSQEVRTRKDLIDSYNYMKSRLEHIV